MFFLFTTPVGAFLPKRKILFEHARRLGSHDYFDVIYSTYGWFTTWMNAELVES